ncbi:Serine/threonine protein kinase [Chitinophaga sp. CF118]|uniref:serine/threonine protein kinase n=1 Tax=Chitinophaga sp. CF118 TaxID=1884367 RepID=UPI0008EE681D|nr:protein kinase [Chitinophaga sp. CF118]SFE45494.1 Serine/threonine protein kinase [Chitinophaga sp. CF118]
MSIPYVVNGFPFPISEVMHYGEILSKFGITYCNDDPWLEVGNCKQAHGWILYLSVLSQDAGKVIHEVAPLLQAYHVPFKLLQNSKLVDASNGQGLGVKDAGKIFMIYPSSVKQALLLAEELELVTKNYEGILIDSCLRIGRILYASPPQGPETKMPFKIPKAYRIRKRKGIIGRYYVPIRLLKFSPKGDINLGVNLKGFSFTPCIIKQARAGSFVDKSERRSFHKLQWQKTVLEDLQDKIPVPRVIDFCRKGNDYYLITEYIEGESLLQKTSLLHGNLTWKDLPAHTRNELLDYFLQIITIISNLHKAGYLHRDIQINNFIIRNKIVHIIDFELAYYMPAGIPHPAFGFGTAGFMSPQQRMSLTPTTAEDIFSLGAVLAYIVINPKSGQEFSGNIYDTLLSAGIENHLLDIIIGCMDPEAEKRPSLPAIINLLGADTLPTNTDNLVKI